MSSKRLYLALVPQNLESQTQVKLNHSKSNSSQTLIELTQSQDKLDDDIKKKFFYNLS